MGDSERYEFTPEQESEIARIVVDYWGGHFQCGFGDEGLPYISLRLSPDTPVKTFDIDTDGTSMMRRG